MTPLLIGYLAGLIKGWHEDGWRGALVYVLLLTAGVGVWFGIWLLS